jgi:putative endonuclease
MTQASNAIGQQGEHIAQMIYKRQGFRIEAVNWRAGRLGEIDLIVVHPQRRILAFVEVKTRKNAHCGHPFEAVGLRKQRQIQLLAEAYLATHPQAPNIQLRFDVVGVAYPGQGCPAEISHLESAFEANF